ncbi:MAG: hypothetical protein HPKKFMNG_02753 [Planctomycetes bacterium]|nr:hypothetical protein [Planctomycetota bacterium]
MTTESLPPNSRAWAASVATRTASRSGLNLRDCVSSISNPSQRMLSALKSTRVSGCREGVMGRREASLDVGDFIAR